MRERTRLDQAIAKYRGFEQRLEDALTLIELGEAEEDEASIAEAEADLTRLRAVVAKRQLASLLSGEADANDCYLEIHAGAGGTEAQDWAQMLTRMYARWAEAHGYEIEWLEESAGVEVEVVFFFCCPPPGIECRAKWLEPVVIVLGEKGLGAFLDRLGSEIRHPRKEVVEGKSE